MNNNTINRRADCVNAERLHQCLHQIAESSQRSPADLLVEAIAQTLGADAVELLVEALRIDANRWKVADDE